MLSRVWIEFVLASVAGTSTGQPSVVGTATAEKGFPRGRLAETVKPERYSLTLYHLPKPRPDGKTTLTLPPLEWLDRVAVHVLIPLRAATGGHMASWRLMPHSVRRCRTGRPPPGPPPWEEDAAQREIADGAMTEPLPA